ncbi:MAG: hypothetical protein L6V35_03075 [Alistipes putredinis]|nr:MAG: hypothetical protein L6V35_03075 [Alistipes putredinis]
MSTTAKLSLARHAQWKNDLYESSDENCATSIFTRALALAAVFVVRAAIPAARIHAVRKDKTRLSVPAVMMMRQRCGYLHCNHEQKHRPDE